MTSTAPQPPTMTATVIRVIADEADGDETVRVAARAAFSSLMSPASVMRRADAGKMAGARDSLKADLTELARILQEAADAL